MREKGNHWLVSVFVAALVTAASGLPVAAATFTLGSADGSFESGLGGTTTTGDVSLVPNLGVLQATQGTQALLMTTSPDAGATPGDADVSTLLIQNFTIGAQYGTLRLSYNFLTNEPGPSFTNDQFLVKLVLVSAGGEQTLLSSDTFDNFLPAPFTGYNTQTGFRSLSADVSAFAGSGDQYTLELRIEDIGDGRRDSAVLIDNLRLVEPGYPTAVANLDYLEINPGDNILLDGRASSDDGSIVEYRWDFGNNSFSTGAFFTILSPYPDAGFYQGSLTVTDNDGNTDTDHFTVAVGGLNRPPVIVSHPVIGAAELVAYRYQVQVEDPELVFGDKMSYALTTAPTGMTIDPDTGVIDWTPPAGAARRHDVTLQVTDSGGLSDSQSYTIAIGPEVYVATLGDDSRFYTARSNGDGTFSGLRLEEDMSTSGATRGVVIADFTGDNNFDLITGYPEDSRLQLFLYERYAGRMQTPVYLGAFDTANPSYLMDMAAEDFDNDADIDFVVDTNTERAWYFENTGPLVTQPEDFYFGGFESDNDGWGGQTCSTTFQRTDTDAFTGSWSLRVAATNNSSCMSIDVNPSNWFLARGSSASFAYRIPAGTPVGLLFNVSGFGWIYLGGSPAADGGIYDFPDTPKVSLIDDGQWHTITFNLRDAIQAHWPGASQVTEFEWYTNSNASNGQEFWFDDFRITRPRMVSGFSAKLLPNTGSAGRGMDAGDANHDGNMDFVRANSGGQLFLYTGDGAGNFTTSQIGTTSDPYGLVMADFDNDSKADVIAINGGSGDPYFYAGNGNGTFQAGVYVPSMDVNNHASYGVFDFNGDGNQDVVVSTYSSQQFWYYPGNGDGSFGERTLIGTTSGSNILSAAAPAGRSIGQPFALATSDATLITEGGTINFDGSDSYDDGTIVSYAWDFGDGSTASGVTTSHDFINEGRYVVILTVTDDSGLKSSFAIHVTVNGELPVADPGGPYTLGEAQSLLGKWHGTLDGTGSSDADTSIARYEWDFDASDGIGVDSTDRYPRPTYSAVGSYTVTLTVYDEVNQSSTATTTVSVTKDAIPVPTINGPATLNESDASLGRWTGWYETSASSDDHGIASYHVAWGDGTTFDLAPLADDFSDGNYTANPVWSVNGGTWSVIDGVLQQSQLGASWRWLQDRSRRYRDFQLEVDVKGISGSTDGYIGIVFRNANGAGSQDTFLLYSQNSWDFWRFYDWSAPSGSNVIAEGGTGWDPEIWYHLRLVMVGDTMQLYVTPEGGVETLQLETTNAAHPRGGIGLLAYDQVLLYDNVKVIPLDSDWDVDGTMLDGVAHTFNATGNYPITLTVVDHVGQSVDALLATPVEAGAPPVADAGGPYTLDEHDAFGGLWNLIVNAGGSSDDTHVERLQVDFGDGTSYTTGFANGVRGSYFASGTDLYGYDTAGADLRRIIATEDGTLVEIVNLATGGVIDSTTLNRMQAWDPSGSPPGDGIFFKVKADKPVVAYFTDLGGHSTFVPSLDGDPVGKEFIFYLDINSGFYVYAYEDAVVSFYNSSNTLIAQRNVRAGDYWDSPAGAADYRVVSSGRISMQTTAANGYTTVPSENGDGAGQLFLFATYTGTTGSIAVFAHEAADIEVFDLDSGASLYTATVAAGQMWYQNSVGTRRLRLESTADVEVWAGDTEAGTTISNLGDDISFAGGRGGTEFVLHTLADGVAIFAPNDNTDVDVDGGALTATLQRDGYLLLAPTDFPGGAGVHRIVTSQPVVIQTLGRSNVFNDLGTYLGGVSMRHQYDTPGIYTLAVTAIDNAGQIHTDTTTVEVKVNDPPIAVIDAPAVADESFAIGGQWSVDFDASGSSDDVGIFSYQWDFGDGTTGSGVSLTHIYTVPGSYTVTLTVTDHAGQQTQTTFIVEVTLGAGPTADAGGPYVFGEEAASYGIWTATLDGSGSTDDSAIFDYVWEFDPLLTEDFAGAAIDTAVWTADAGASIQSGRLVNPGSGWGPTGHYSVQSIKRIAGTVRITGEIQTPSSGNAMWGFFTAAPSNFSYTNMPHAIYFSSGTLYVYENGSQRGNVGSYTRGETYEARIDLYESGASYYIRLAGSAEWTPLTAFTPTNPSNSPLRMGASVNSGSFAFDNYRIVELLEGPIVTREYSEVGTHNVTLTVRDNALQVDTDTTTITIADGAPPVAEAGGDYTAEVGSFVQFNGTGSTDDVAIQTYHWLFGDTTGGAADLPFTGKGPAPRHFYQQVGSYTAELTVTDNTLKSDSDTATVNVIVGAPPVASGQAVSQGAAGGPPVYFNAENSSDDFGIVEYRWDFDAELDRDGDGDPTNDIDAVGARPFHTYPSATTPATTFYNDDFDDGVINGWTTNGTVVEAGGTLQVTGNNWGSGYIFTDQTFDRAALRLTALVHTSATSGNHMMFGVKNNNTASGHYNQLNHAIYFASGTLYVYEDGSQRGNVGSYTPGGSYEVRIDIKSVGADYYIRQQGAAAWTALTNYTSLGRSSTPVRIGADAHSGVWGFDDVQLTGTGPKLVTLTVEDGAGQTSSMQLPVDIAPNLPPDVIAVPWVAHDLLVPHEIYNGKTVHLKGIVRDADAQTFQWDFGDGTQSAVTNITNKYDLSVTHTYPDAPNGTPFTAKLRVWDSLNQMGEDSYIIVVKPKTLSTETNVAIDEGLWYLHQQQTRTTAEGYDIGYWTSDARASATASSIQSFLINSHLETVDPAEDPYQETVMRGLRQLFRDLGTVAIATQTYGEPDTNGNDLGIQTGVNSSGSQPIYQGGQVM
ncbi:MAG: PKD domain-containing protein, partial [Gammaproteobacteria bacterium]|nr:PKD domain-containing protein [Gammaproteobacteria bacterium]